MKYKKTPILVLILCWTSALATYKQTQYLRKFKLTNESASEKIFIIKLARNSYDVKLSDKKVPLINQYNCHHIKIPAATNGKSSTISGNLLATKLETNNLVNNIIFGAYTVGISGTHQKLTIYGNAPEQDINCTFSSNNSLVCER